MDIYIYIFVQLFLSHTIKSVLYQILMGGLGLAVKSNSKVKFGYATRGMGSSFN